MLFAATKETPSLMHSAQNGFEKTLFYKVPDVGLLKHIKECFFYFYF